MRETAQKTLCRRTRTTSVFAPGPISVRPSAASLVMHIGQCLTCIPSEEHRRAISKCCAADHRPGLARRLSVCTKVFAPFWGWCRPRTSARCCCCSSTGVLRQAGDLAWCAPKKHGTCHCVSGGRGRFACRSGPRIFPRGANRVEASEAVADRVIKLRVVNNSE